MLRNIDPLRVWRSIVNGWTLTRPGHSVKRVLSDFDSLQNNSKTRSIMSTRFGLRLERIARVFSISEQTNFIRGRNVFWVAFAWRNGFKIVRFGFLVVRFHCYQEGKYLRRCVYTRSMAATMYERSIHIIPLRLYVIDTHVHACSCIYVHMFT